jgi:hypothetical protein
MSPPEIDFLVTQDVKKQDSKKIQKQHKEKPLE